MFTNAYQLQHLARETTQARTREARQRQIARRFANWRRTQAAR
ncbi:MAG TPA: hypothetical protein VFM49_17885 [Chloroflexia bacterium]|jgi:hypothetical protein|nr:hypothetical protein [Chloroflexia bacterium]